MRSKRVCLPRPAPHHHRHRQRFHPRRPYQVLREMDERQYHERTARVFDALEDVLEGDGVALPDGSEPDAALADGVLNLVAGEAGTWVLNKHSASKQMWLSSPVSGPRKFYFDEGRGRWVDERDPGLALQALLEEELGALFGRDAVSFGDQEF